MRARLRYVHANEKEAERTAKARLDELRRGNDTLSITMPGDPLVAAEGQIIALGERLMVDSKCEACDHLERFYHLDQNGKTKHLRLAGQTE